MLQAWRAYYELQVTAASLAVVSNGLVKEWRVYADNKPVYDILARRSSKSAGS
jgi:hypothetical protein